MRSPAGGWFVLRHHPIVRTCIAYLLVAWIVIQVANNVSGPLRLPEWFPTLVIVLVAAGFPFSILLAWTSTLNPSDAAPSIASAKVRLRLTRRAMVGLVLLSAGAAVAVVVTTGPSSESVLQKPDQSIVVLPFADLSEARDQQYFGDGMMDEILTALSNTEGLRVISRTTAMQYRSSPKTLRAIGQELGVGHVLEGSVRRTDDRIRITAKLVEVATEEHLWAETYDRELKDVFAVQTDIAEAIAKALQTSLSPEMRDRMASGRPESVSAYDLYLQGRAYLARAESSPDNREFRKELENAIIVFRRAIEMEPGYARAYAGLALSFGMLSSGDTWPSVARDSAEQYGKAAIEAAPDLAEAHGALARNYQTWGQFRLASEHLARALSIDPNDADAVTGMAYVSLALGRFDEAIRWGTKLVTLAPTAPTGYVVLERAYFGLEMYGEAEALAHRRIIVAPDDAGARIGLYYLYVYSGEPERAKAQLDSIQSIGHESSVMALQAHEALGAREWDRAIALGENLLDDDPANHSYLLLLAHAYQALGETERADSALVFVENVAHQRIATGDEGYAPFWLLLLSSAIRGDTPGARRWIREVFRHGGLELYVDMMRHPSLAEIRTDAGVQQVLGEMGREVSRQRRRVEQQAL